MWRTKGIRSYNTVSKRYTQTVPVSGTAGDIFTFGGWAKAATVPLDSASMENRTDYLRRAGIAVALYNGTTAAGTSYIPVNTAKHILFLFVLRFKEECS